MNTHTNRVLGLIVAVTIAMGLILSLGACGSPETTVTGPAPTVTVTPTPEPTGPSDSDYDQEDVAYVLYRDTFEENWANMSKSGRKDMCLAYYLYPAEFEQEAHKVVRNNGVTGWEARVATEAFMDLIREVC